ncbi:hypothetical protein MPNTM1_04184 [Mycolicibacterium parafortuitum]|uniref:hypothetical protein n=1 Tax=Mycolicibacterium parafortuitum TaxID=39692 RepID=UPI0032C46C28
MTTKAKPTADELDAALVAALRASPGECGWWSDLREQLPESTYWERVESLTRLVDSGRVQHTKIDGRNMICLAIRIGPAA